MWYIRQNIGLWLGYANSYTGNLRTSYFSSVIFSFINQIPVERQQCVQVYCTENLGTGGGPKT